MRRLAVLFLVGPAAVAVAGGALPHSAATAPQPPHVRPCVDCETHVGGTSLLKAAAAKSAAAGHDTTFKTTIPPTSDVNETLARSLESTGTGILAPFELQQPVNAVFAIIWLVLMGSSTLLMTKYDKGEVLRSRCMQCLGLSVGLIFFTILFCYFLEFSSLHWNGNRTLTVVEATYLMSQTITTIGFGDIVPVTDTGKIWVSIFMLFGLVLTAEVIGEFTRFVSSGGKAVVDTYSSTDEIEATELSVKLFRPEVKVPVWRLFNAVVLFCSVSFLGMAFYHFYPGEGKSWVDGVYMSVIALSTNGFGPWVPDTEGGMTFAAYWLFIGVAALGNALSTFGELMHAIKERRAWNTSYRKDVFEDAVKCVDTDAANRIDQYEFMRFALMYSDLATEEDLLTIEQAFEEICPDPDGRVSLDVVKKFDLSQTARSRSGSPKARSRSPQRSGRLTTPTFNRQLSEPREEAAPGLAPVPPLPAGQGYFGSRS